MNPRGMAKRYFALIVLTLLVGCKSKGGRNSELQPPLEPLPVADATVVEIAVTPSTVLVLEGRTQQLVAIAKYDDGSESDVSNSVSWSIIGDPTVADVSTSGLLTGNTRGDIDVTAIKDGITSNTINVTVCDLAGACLDFFDVGGGKLFTNSPSKAYLDSIGGSANNGVVTENGTLGPIGDFYVFNWNNANTLCATYNANSIGGRTNWQLATRDELKIELHDVFGNMFSARGWPTIEFYWSITPDNSNYFDVGLNDGLIFGSNPVDTDYASCVSEP
ncbi:TPA: Ig-like domain-containing protein [Vibrio cholerae]